MRTAAGAAALACALLAFASGAGLAPAPAAAEEIRDLLGASHAAGTYNFTSENFLNEGADQLLDLGTRVIKVWFTLDPASRYPFNSHWGAAPADLLELARNPYFQELFAKPFSTFILVVGLESGGLFLDNLSLADLAAEERQIHDLALYLLTTYAGTGKTFILQNWEGDHTLNAGLDAGATPNRRRIQHLALWWNARQAGVEAARAEAAGSGVNVYDAIEVNALRDAMAGKTTATNDLLPLTQADLYSYSSWDAGFDPEQLTRALDYLQSRTSPSAAFGRRNIYLGEFGAAKDQTPPGESRPAVIRRLASTALAWGVRFALYWQLYCNEEVETVNGRPDNQQLRGFWLIRPDGIRAPMWYDFKRMLGRSLSHLALRTASGQYLASPGAGGGALAGSWTLGPWQVFAATSESGGALASGDSILLQAHDGMVVTAERGKLAAVVARGWDPDPSDAFVIRKLAGGGPIREGDAITLQSASGRYVTFDLATGALRANRLHPGPAGIFRLEPQD